MARAMSPEQGSAGAVAPWPWGQLTWAVPALWRTQELQKHHRHTLGGECTESSPEEKGLGVLVDEKRDMGQQCVLAALCLGLQHRKQGEGGECLPLLCSLGPPFVRG